MPDFLFVKTSGEYLKLPLSEIVYIEALNKYVKIMGKKKHYLMQSTMNHMEKLLPPDIFRRVHRSFIVSLYHVDKFDNNAVYLGTQKLPIGKHYKDSLMIGIIILCTDEKNGDKSSNNMGKLLRNINPQ